MIDLQDVIIKIRSRLKDENYHDLRFSDSEIIDGINATSRALTLNLKLNKKQITKEISTRHPFIHLPHLLHIQSAQFNRTLLLKRTDMPKPSGSIELLITHEGVSVTPFFEGTLSLVYSEYEPLNSESETLEFSPMALDCIVYGTLALMLEINTADENYQKIGFFKALYKEAENAYIAHLNSLYTRPNPSSKVVRI